MKKIVMTGLAAVLAVTLTACGGSGAGKNTVIPGLTGPDVSVVNGDVIVSMVFTDISVSAGVSVPLGSKYPNSSIAFGPDFQSAGALLTLTVSVSDFLGADATLLNPQTLPGGRPLPGVAAGQLPAIAVQIPQLDNTVLYLGPSVIGFFVPLSGLNLAGTIVSSTFYNTSSAEVGILSLVGADASGANSGVLLMLNTTELGISSSASSNAKVKK